MAVDDDDIMESSWCGGASEESSIGRQEGGDMPGTTSGGSRWRVDDLTKTASGGCRSPHVSGSTDCRIHTETMS